MSKFTSNVRISRESELMPSFMDIMIVNWRFWASFSVGEMTAPFCCDANTSSSSLMEPPLLFLSCFSNSMFAAVSNLASSMRLLRRQDPPCCKERSPLSVKCICVFYSLLLLLFYVVIVLPTDTFFKFT